jgi:hypothetical protein
MNCKIFYRISSNSLPKPKLPGADKFRCLDNFISAFGPEINVLADNCDEQILNEIERRSLKTLVTDYGNAQSFLFTLSEVKYCPDDTLIYFVEDDYLHLPTSRTLLEEGIASGVDYVTLYDHPDKYGPLYSGGEMSKVFRTASSHWRTSISTCMTFASTAGILKKDMEIWHQWCKGDIPDDHGAFSYLNAQGRKLAVCIPGAACHTDLNYSTIIGENWIEPWAIQLMLKTIEQSIYKSYDADAIDLMEDVLHRQKKEHNELTKLMLISEIENHSKKKRASKP